MRDAAVVLLAVAGLLAGCQPGREAPGPAVICPGKPSIEEAVHTLRQRQAKLHPLRASVQAVLEWTDEEGRKRSERLDAQLRYVPPDRFLLSGNKLGLGKISFGYNPEAFWLAEEAYWWGSRAAGELCSRVLPYDLWHVAQALGAVEVDASWTLEKEPGFDVLTKPGPGGSAERRIWVQACSYLIDRIEIYPASNEIIRILPGDYRVTEQDYPVASRIRAEHYRNTDAVGAVTLELSGIRYFEASETQMQRLFERPSAERYKNVYMLTEDSELIRVEP